MPACQQPKMRNTKSEARHFLIHYGIAQKHTAFQKKKTKTQK